MFNSNEIKNDASKMFIYFSRLMDRPVFDKNREEVGILYDIVVKPSEVYPQSSALIIKKGTLKRRYAVVSWSDVTNIGEKEVALNIRRSHLNFSKKRENREELTLRRDILDQQVVDMYNQKVIRVNDIHLLLVDHCIMTAHVDISNRGLLRRLGLEKFVDLLVRLFNRNSAYLKEEHLISWKYIQPLSINPVSMSIKVSIPQKQFNNIPAADLGEVFLDLNIKDQIALFKSLDIKTKARIFINIDFKTQQSLVEEMKDQEKAEILSNIPSDEATDFLEKLPSNQADHILTLVESKYSQRLSQLLGYSNNSAGGLMTTEYMAFSKDTTVEAALKQIKERTFTIEPAQFVYILDEANRLVGATNFRRIMSADPLSPIQSAAFPKTYFVHLNSSVKEVAYLMEKYKYYAIPVVDDKNIFQGIITVDDILSQVISIAWRRLKRIKVAPKK
ncbi:MAG TPA: CBS domain-containing protein [Candidatus Margulisiibacteriota bacterium]|nr:CBS domain-containing protein [Candidatus Margulisiibacteriota bacterium]